MKKSKKKFFLIIGIILSISMFISGICIPKESNNDKDLIIVEQFEATSSVQDSILQKYITTITGTIKNVSDKDISNLKLYINVETSYLHNKGKLEFDIELIKANNEYVINAEFETTENFETILNIYATNANNETIKLENYTNLAVTKIMLISISIISLIACSLGLVIKKNNNLQNNQLKNEDDIEYLENKLKKEELKAKIKSFEKNTICPYCGTNNDSKNKKCDNCGASLK